MSAILVNNNGKDTAAAIREAELKAAPTTVSPASEPQGCNNTPKILVAEGTTTTTMESVPQVESKNKEKEDTSNSKAEEDSSKSNADEDRMADVTGLAPPPPPPAKQAKTMESAPQVKNKNSVEEDASDSNLEEDASKSNMDEDSTESTSILAPTPAKEAKTIETAAQAESNSNGEEGDSKTDVENDVVLLASTSEASTEPRPQVPELRDFDAKMQRLIAFKEKYLTFVVKPSQLPEYKDLDEWATWIRHYKKSLSPEQLCQLYSIKFKWSEPGKQVGKSQQRWEIMFAKLENYKQRYGDCLVPVRWKEDPALGKWVSRQRDTNNCRYLSDERKARLDGIGFTWNAKFLGSQMEVRPSPVEGSIPAKQQQKKKQAAATHDISKIYDILKKPKPKKPKPTKAKPTKPKAAPKVAPKTAPKKAPEECKEGTDYEWEAQFEKLLHFKNKHGHTNVPQPVTADPEFGAWVRAQCHDLRQRTTLQQYRRFWSLEGIGFNFDQYTSSPDVEAPRCGVSCPTGLKEDTPNPGAATVTPTGGKAPPGKCNVSTGINANSKSCTLPTTAPTTSEKASIVNVSIGRKSEAEGTVAATKTSTKTPTSGKAPQGKLGVSTGIKTSGKSSLGEMVMMTISTAPKCQKTSQRKRASSVLPGKKTEAQGSIVSRTTISNSSTAKRAEAESPARHDTKQLPVVTPTNVPIMNRVLKGMETTGGNGPSSLEIRNKEESKHANHETMDSKQVNNELVPVESKPSNIEAVETARQGAVEPSWNVLSQGRYDPDGWDSLQAQREISFLERQHEKATPVRRNFLPFQQPLPNSRDAAMLPDFDSMPSSQQPYSANLNRQKPNNIDAATIPESQPFNLPPSRVIEAPQSAGNNAPKPPSAPKKRRRHKNEEARSFAAACKARMRQQQKRRRTLT
ncbi:helicase [Seminavis robusta]|uniref:Helicase n=1 Tax=Seminavis robusta TaxID=568900 RepID=A0A9N8HQ26_9STRA|nr:helicase [Seminavis robusta]|eukprot:Sro1151_g246810.1 helicase (912) ;mRNA; r:31037-33967